MFYASISIFVLIAILIGTVILQVFLSRMENKWIGLILPALSFFIASIIGIGRIIYDFQTSFSVILADILTFLLYNIPTAIFLLIYLTCREKFKKNKEIEKMNIQDL